MYVCIDTKLPLQILFYLILLVVKQFRFVVSLISKLKESAPGRKVSQSGSWRDILRKCIVSPLQQK